MKQWTVSVSRTIIQFQDVTVEAETEEEAKEEAIEDAIINTFAWEDFGIGDDYEVHEITEDKSQPLPFEPVK